jgi:filamentous hemagglutinin family protein
MPSTTWANPTGGQIVAGSATITQPSSSTVQVNQTSQKAIIDWRSFNIAPTELTRFNQPNASAIVLNRVTGGDPSQILGSIQSNGQVWLINPNGIVFGASAKIDVAGLLATTLDIANSDFMAGNYKFASTGAPAGTIVNAGQITVKSAGLAALGSRLNQIQKARMVARATADKKLRASLS